MRIISAPAENLSDYLVLILLNFSVYQDDSSDELSEVMDDLLLPASDTDDNWFQDDDDPEEETETDDSDNDESENNDGLESEDNSSDNEVSLVNGNLKTNGDEQMDSE